MVEGVGLRKVDARLHGKDDSNSHGARPVHLIISMIEWIRTSGLSIKISLSPGASRPPHQPGYEPARPMVGEVTSPQSPPWGLGLRVWCAARCPTRLPSTRQECPAQVRCVHLPAFMHTSRHKILGCDSQYRGTSLIRNRPPPRATIGP